MRVQKKVYLDVSIELHAEIQKLDIHVETGYTSLTLDYSDDKLCALETLLKQMGVSTEEEFSTTFSESDLDQSKHLDIVTRHVGYPQPEDPLRVFP